MLQSLLGEDQHHIDKGVLERLKDGHRKAFAVLAVVIHAEPLFGGVSTTSDHELRAKEATDRPRGHENGGNDIEAFKDAKLGATLSHDVDGDRNGSDEAAKRRQAALPNSQNLSWM